MDVTDPDLAAARARTEALRSEGYAVGARYDRAADRVVVSLDTGEEIVFAPSAVRALAGAAAEDLAVIEIGPSGLSLLWPRLDEGLSLPTLTAGTSGTRRGAAEPAAR